MTRMCIYCEYMRLGESNIKKRKTGVNNVDIVIYNHVYTYKIVDIIVCGRFMNGNNGSWTNSDDVPPFKVEGGGSYNFCKKNGCTNRVRAHFHQAFVKKEKTQKLVGAARRLAEKEKPRQLCMEACLDPECILPHWHPDKKVKFYSETALDDLKDEIIKRENVSNIVVVKEGEVINNFNDINLVPPPETELTFDEFGAELEKWSIEVCEKQRVSRKEFPIVKPPGLPEPRPEDYVVYPMIPRPAPGLIMPEDNEDVIRLINDRNDNIENPPDDDVPEGDRGPIPPQQDQAVQERPAVMNAIQPANNIYVGMPPGLNQGPGEDPPIIELPRIEPVTIPLYISKQWWVRKLGARVGELVTIACSVIDVFDLFGLPQGLPELINGSLTTSSWANVVRVESWPLTTWGEYSTTLEELKFNSCINVNIYPQLARRLITMRWSANINSATPRTLLGYATQYATEVELADIGIVVYTAMYSYVWIMMSHRRFVDVMTPQSSELAKRLA